VSAVSTPEGRVLPSEEEVRRLVAAVLERATAGAPDAGPVEPAASSVGDRAATSSARVEVAVGADHGGYTLKERIVADLRDQGFDVRDCGTDGTEAVDYPDFAHRVARLVADGDCRAGIVVDGAGIGSCMVANKVPGVRAATCWDLSSARNSREHNHANVLALGAGLIGESLALDIVRTWLATPWGGDRHARRVGKIDEIELRYVSARAETGAAR
jgi:ribose 5-phosphate isomerase B